MNSQGISVDFPGFERLPRKGDSVKCRTAKRSVKIDIGGTYFRRQGLRYQKCSTIGAHCARSPDRSLGKVDIGRFLIAASEWDVSRPRELLVRRVEDIVGEEPSNGVHVRHRIAGSVKQLAVRIDAGNVESRHCIVGIPYGGIAEFYLEPQSGQHVLELESYPVHALAQWVSGGIGYHQVVVLDEAGILDREQIGRRIRDDSVGLVRPNGTEAVVHRALPLLLG